MDIAIDLRSTLIFGNNGTGKTTLLSALYGLFDGLPWPATTWKDHLSIGSEYFGVRASPEWFVSALVSPTGRIVRKYSGEIPEDYRYTVFTYVPEDNQWLSLARAARLAIMDRIVGALSGSTFQSSMNTLTLCLLNKQRILKKYKLEGVVDTMLYKYYHEQLGLVSHSIWMDRRRVYALLQPQMIEFADWIDTRLYSLRWVWNRQFSTQTIPLEEDFSWPSWEVAWKVESRANKTLYGAQRDDIQLVSNGSNAAQFFSRGEMRALVIFVNTISRNMSQKKVLWLLDDLFNELDSGREKLVFSKMIREGDGVVATATRKIEGFGNYIML